jgi:hypothetical protein
VTARGIRAERRDGGHPAAGTDVLLFSDVDDAHLCSRTERRIRPAPHQPVPTHNRYHATFADFKAAVLTFLREEVPRKWRTYCDEVTDNFRIISPKDFRVLA